MKNIDKETREYRVFAKELNKYKDACAAELIKELKTKWKEKLKKFKNTSSLHKI